MRRQLELTPRLRLLAEWVPPGASFADIGTDHGCLPAWLVLEGRVRRCLATDLRVAPLQRAKETAREWGAAGIRFRLCNGLAAVRPEEAEVIAIAGLGGENIAAILVRAPWTADGRHTLLLQPMTRAEVLRRFLAGHGYSIRREALVRDRGIMYPVMEAVAGHMTLTPGREYGGAALVRDPLGDRYLIETILRLQNAVAGLNRSSRSSGSSCSDVSSRFSGPTCSDSPSRFNDSSRPAGKPGETTQRGTCETCKNQTEADRRRVLENQARADRLRDILTELFSMREEWRNANREGN